ncbi:type V secretion system putative substrate protein [Collimonas sp. PA-H2]|uniref:ESPR domain-containing protein n=1 Tax=Collimonas sp. PA-H2 TaxID=1881062 RepID=UPI000BF47A37|nr:type V secretion system putative substrate protein [Collimonas sp. PA-H2]
MNKIYRTVYSQILGTWVAVSELVAAKGKRSGSSRSVGAPAAARGAIWAAFLEGGLPLKPAVVALVLALPLSGYASTIANTGGSGCGPTYTGPDGTVFTAPGLHLCTRPTVPAISRRWPVVALAAAVSLV